ncbi:hypothetical protein K0M31_012129 [Melipona bicolor]|uniref:Uncharacterized protein n=1 Tax=Melipona bicolor TaxID=60889 RepID=A0AA40KVN8_9HYME|nr:hypothetical protein K0M31_012129 [Melipona bicolor]
MCRQTATRKREQRSYLVAEGEVEAISENNLASDGKSPGMDKFNDEDDSLSCATRSLIRGREFLQFRAAASAGCCNKTARANNKAPAKQVCSTTTWLPYREENRGKQSAEISTAGQLKCLTVAFYAR